MIMVDMPKHNIKTSAKEETMPGISCWGSAVKPGVISLSTLSSCGDVIVKALGELKTRRSSAPSGFYFRPNRRKAEYER